VNAVGVSRTWLFAMTVCSCEESGVKLHNDVVLVPSQDSHRGTIVGRRDQPVALESIAVSILRPVILRM
jgi:hypothetical protein